MELKELKQGCKMKRGVNASLQVNECDSNDEYGSEYTHFYMSLIGILRWIVELGRIDITYEYSIMLFLRCTGLSICNS